MQARSPTRVGLHRCRGITPKKATYDTEVYVLRIRLSNATINASDEERPGVVLDYDADENVVALEILDASQRVDEPFAVEYVLNRR